MDQFDKDTAPFFERLRGSVPAFVRFQMEYGEVILRAKALLGLRAALIASDVEKLAWNAERHARLMAEALPAYSDHARFGSLFSYVEAVLMRASVTRGELRIDKQRLEPYAVFSSEPVLGLVERELLRDVFSIAHDHLNRIDDVERAIRVIKQGRTYRLETGEEQLNQRSQPGDAITIGTVVAGRVNIQSTDRSTNVDVRGDIFLQLRSQALDVSNDVEREGILARIADLEVQRGKPGFTAAYRRFMSDAADHLAVFGPSLSALAAMLPG